MGNSNDNSLVIWTPLLKEPYDKSKAAVQLGRIFCPIVIDRDKFSNREQSENNRNDGNAMCDYLSEY